MYILLFVLLVTGCDKPDKTDTVPDTDTITNFPDYKIIDDIYQGYISYQGKKYWYAVKLEANGFDESPSDANYYSKSQKCLSVGSFSINKDKLVFEVDSFLYGETPASECNPDFILPGVYTIDSLANKSLVFERGGSNSRIVYSLIGIDYDEVFDSKDSVISFLIGEWEWIKSCGGYAGGCILSDTVEYAMRKVITKIPDTKDSILTIDYKDNSIIDIRRAKVAYSRSGYGLSWNIEETLPGLYFSKLTLRNISEDTLSFAENCDDCYVHTYVRLDSLKSFE